LGNGLEGFYSFEYRTDKGNTAVRNNKSLVGLRGDFGQFKIGRGFDAAPYELVYSGTDVANWQSGTAKGGYAGDSNVYYRTPNMDGFEAGMGFQVDGSGDNANGEDLNNWNIAAKYSMQGLTAGVAYSASPNGLQVEDAKGPVSTAAEGADATATGVWEDKSAWGIALGYGQDNWSLNGWYGEDNSGDQKFGGYTAAKDAPEDDEATPNIDESVETDAQEKAREEVDGKEAQDRTAFSLSGTVAVDKMNLYVVYESIDGINAGNKDIYTTLGATYNLGAKARVWLEYIAQDLDSDSTADDYVAIGLRHDF
jgi:predicted porin